MMEEAALHKNFPDDSLLIVGNAQVAEGNPIGRRHGAFFISFVVTSDGVVLDCSASVVLSLTDRFIRDFFIGRSLLDDEAEILEDIETRYHGSSRKTLGVCYKDALKKFKDVKEQRGKKNAEKKPI